MPTIACVIQRYHPAVGGSEKMLKMVAETLVRRGYSVNVYTTTAVEITEMFKWSKRPASTEIINGVRVFRCRTFAMPFPTLPYRFVDKLFSIYPSGPHSLGLIRRLAADPYDVLLSTTFPYSLNYFSYLFGRVRRKPLLFLPHPHFADRYHYHRPSLFALLRGADAVLANTHFEADEYVRHGVDPKKIFVAGCCIEPHEFGSAPSNLKQQHAASRMILFLARKAEGKGPGLLVQAARLLSQRHPDWLFVFAGPDTDFSLNLFASPEARHANVLNLGQVSEAQKHALLAECDLFVLPSTVESFGIVYLEAWMYQKPVIGVNIGSTSELISHGEDGLVVSTHDPRALAEAIERTLTDLRIARRMGESGHAKVMKRFTAEAVTDVFEKAIRYAVRRKGRKQ